MCASAIEMSEMRRCLLACAPRSALLATIVAAQSPVGVFDAESDVCSHNDDVVERAAFRNVRITTAAH